MNGKSKQTLLSEKPYGFVPVIPLRPQDRLPVATVGHNVFRNDCISGCLAMRVVAETPLHMGTGRLGWGGGDVVRMLSRRNQVPVIPGSGLKGVVRSIAESVSRSCGPTLPDGRRDCTRLYGRGLPRENLVPCTKEAACVICRLFGFVTHRRTSGRADADSFRSRVVFGEFRPENGMPKIEYIPIPALFSPFRDYPRGACGNERLYYCALHETGNCAGGDKCQVCGKGDFFSARKGTSPATRPIRFRGRKLYYHGEVEQGQQLHEVLPAGTALTGRVTFENLHFDELALLAFAMGLDGSFKLKLGYGKPAYLGTVRTELIGFRPLQRPYAPGGRDLDIAGLAADYAENDGTLKAQKEHLRAILSGSRKGPAWRRVDNVKTY